MFMTRVSTALPPSSQDRLPTFGIALARIILSQSISSLTCSSNNLPRTSSPTYLYGSERDMDIDEYSRLFVNSIMLRNWQGYIERFILFLKSVEN